jgi:hypothetical protein
VHGAGVFGAGGSHGNGDLTFKGHAAGRTGSGLGLADFGAHGTDVGGRASGFRRSASDFRPRTLDLGLRSGSGRRADCDSMHRSGCGRLRRGHSQHHQWGRLGSGRVQISLRIRLELFCAAGAAEVILFSGVLVDVLGRGGIDGHSTDGVALESGGWVRSCHERAEAIAAIVSQPGLSQPSLETRIPDTRVSGIGGGCWARGPIEPTPSVPTQSVPTQHRFDAGYFLGWEMLGADEATRYLPSSSFTGAKSSAKFEPSPSMIRARK